MLRSVYTLLLCCLLMAFAGCEKSTNLQSSSNSQASASPQASGPATTTTTTTTSTTTTAAAPAGQPTTNGAADPAATDKPKFDACTLLTKAEVQAVQGEPVTDTKSDGRNEGGMSVSQCFYAVTSFSKSVSLVVTRNNPDAPTQSAPRDFWQRTFHRDEPEGDRDREREREKERDKKGESERERERRGEAGREQPRGGRGEEEEEEERTPPKKITGVGEEAYWMGSRVGGALYVLKKNAFIRISVGGPGSEEEKINKSKTLVQKALKRL